MVGASATGGAAVVRGASANEVPVVRGASAGATAVVRLNWGCGSHVAAGWINSDIKGEPGVDLVADVRAGLPLASESCDYAVSVHALPELSYPELQGALEELRRVLKPGGVLRLALPDLRRGIDAYLRGDLDYFQVDPEEVSSAGGRFIVHMLWYGYSRSLFTVDFAEELLRRAGFVEVRECAFGTTASGFEQITELDNRPEESLFVEARRGDGRSEEGAFVQARRGDGRPEKGPSADTRYEPDGDRRSRRAARRGRSGRRSRRYNRAIAQEQGIEQDKEAAVEIVDLTHATPDERLRCHFRVEQDGSTLQLVGWALGSDSPVLCVEVLSRDEVVATTAPTLERPDIAEAFPDLEGAGACGFRLAIEPSGKGQSRLELRATFADGERAPIGELEVRTPERRRKGILRRFG